MNTIFLGGDFRFFWPENISDFANLPFAWDSSLNTGIGEPQIGSLWITSYLYFTSLTSKLGFSWEIISLMFWILPAVLLSFSSAYLLFKYLFPNKKLFGLLSGFIYLGNTYFLMIFTGGQAGVSLSYSLIPLTLLIFIKTINNLNLRNSILAGLIVSLQILFDPRIAYISGISVLIYLLLNLSRLISLKNKIFLLPPFIIPVLLNSFWILPLLLIKSSPIPKGFDSIEGFRFFSFSDLSHAISLLHSNFPENIFGKTYFQDPWFLMIPILAFSSLLFINFKHKAQRSNNNLTMEQPARHDKQGVAGGSNNIAVLFFAFLALIGAFLAKGSNEPFGQINEFLFNFFPGMSMFRDPTKFYILIALSYSILIPFSVWQISEWTIKRIKFSIFNAHNLFFLFTIFYLLFLLRPLWTEGFLGKFKPRPVPSDYVVLKDFLVSQPEFSRTLWIPQWQRFGYFSNTHPAIGRGEVLKGDVKSQLRELRKPGTEGKLKNLSVKYIIVPYDSEEEIFLDDRKYDDKKYKDATSSLQKLSWLSEVPGFGRIHVYEVREPKDRFWCDCEALINYKFISPTRYGVSVKNAKKGDILIFSEGFDKGWMFETLASKGETLQGYSQKFEKKFENLNSFVLPKNGNYELKISYKPQKWVNFGLAIGFLTLVGVLSFLMFGLRGKK